MRIATTTEQTRQLQEGSTLMWKQTAPYSHSHQGKTRGKIPGAIA